MDSRIDVTSIAHEVLDALTDHRQIPTFSSRSMEFSLGQAYRVTEILRSAFEARGERIVGRKIGFTNRDMWEVYGVKSPVWGYATDRTTSELASVRTVRINDFVEPRIEPEIMFGLKASPSPEINDDALLGCVGWVSLGYEVVQSIYPGWKFTAADTVAANGVHGALLVGERHPLEPSKIQRWKDALATFTVELYCDGELSQRGSGALVLGSPLLALRHLIQALADNPNSPPLHGGDIISTGTLTLAMPVLAGQCWTTKVFGLPLEEITLEFD
jgi:2-oxo-3-hexenedioate decarboxylase